MLQNKGLGNHDLANLNQAHVRYPGAPLQPLNYGSSLRQPRTSLRAHDNRAAHFSKNIDNGLYLPGGLSPPKDMIIDQKKSRSTSNN